MSKDEQANRDEQASNDEKQKFIIITIMFYGGLTLCATGIEGVSFYAGLGLGLAIQGLLLAYREGCWK